MMKNVASAAFTAMNNCSLTPSCLSCHRFFNCHQEFGKRWRWVLDISILINNIGICTVYLIIIGEDSLRLADASSPSHPAGARNGPHLAFVLLPPPRVPAWKCILLFHSSPNAVSEKCSHSLFPYRPADVLCGTYRAVNVANIHEGLLVEWNGGQAAWWTSRVLVLFIITLVILLPLVSLRHVGEWTRGGRVVEGHCSCEALQTMWFDRSLRGDHLVVRRHKISLTNLR